MSRTIGLSSSFLAAACMGLLPALAVAEPVIGQVDDFEDGTTQGWVINLLGTGSPPPEAIPENVPSGGPAGQDDNYLQLTSVGGFGGGGRLVAINPAPRWAGDYIAAGVDAITMHVSNLGQTDLSLRLLFEDPTVGPPVNIAFSTEAISVPSNSGWMTVTFPIALGDLTAGLGSVDAALTATTIIRLYHSVDPNFPNPISPIPPIVAELGVDNIAALPEPASLLLLGTGLAGALVGKRRNR